MASYCSATDIQVALNLKTAFANDGTSNPTLTQVESVIDQVTKEIDTYLNAIGITSQPTNTNVLGLLKTVCIYGAACRIGVSYKRNNDSVGGSADWYCSNYRMELDRILEKPEILANITDADIIYVGNQVTDGTMTEKEVQDILIGNEYKY